MFNFSFFVKKKMERKTKKVKKEGDTCRDCWTKRFRKDLCMQFEHEQELPVPPTLSNFLNRERESRELAIKNMREEFHDLYDEIDAIQVLAGDVYLGRYEAKDKED
jgi:hypothetical protein